MNQDRWSDINRIFHAALEVEPGNRHSFVATESNGDPDLQAEVELLLRADADAGSFLDFPLIPEESLSLPQSPLAPGDVLCGRFRIIREIAEGGMGHVFEAFDSELAVRVALKVIRTEFAANSEAVARFRQEVRLARTITHANICRTFDLERETRLINGRNVEFFFLTMEFLSGESLGARLKREGKLPLDDTIAIARDVAAALGAAHALGIIHRDMKPGNIMLVAPESGVQDSVRAVVTDFGLARIDRMQMAPVVSSFSHSGVVGTLAYMAPEQITKGPALPSMDIYAFGLILYEMVTGERAFTPDNLLNGIAQRLQGSSSLIELQNKQVPAHWRRAIKACLEVEPSDRPKDAATVVRMLEGPPRRFLTELPRSLAFRGERLRLVVGSLIALLCLVALFPAFLRLYQGRRDSRVSPGSLVYLTPVANQTAEKSLDNLTDLLQAGLSQSHQVALLDQGRVGDTLQQMTKPPQSMIDSVTGREIAMRNGAVRVIFATVNSSRGRYNLNVDIQQPDSTPIRYRARWTKTFTWQASGISHSDTIPPALLTQVRLASDWIRNVVGESANDIARLDTPPEDVTTADWRALAAYADAERLNSLNRTSDGIEELRNAVHIDPGFALAYARLGDLLLSRERYAEGYAAYRQALATANLQRLTRHELDRIRGIYALDTRDYDTAERVFRDATIYYENDYLGWFYRGDALMMLNRTAEAISSMQRAVTLRPLSFSARFNLASYLFIQRSDDAARHEIADLRSRGQGDGAIWLEAEDLYLNQRHSEALSHLEPLRRHPTGLLRSIGFDLSASVAAASGDNDQAISFLTQGMDVDRSAGSSGEFAEKQLGRAALECRLGRFDACLDDVKGAVTVDNSPQALRSADRVLGIAITDAPAPLAARIRIALEENVRALPPDELGPVAAVARAEGRAELLLVEGNANAAFGELRRASTLDAPRAPRDLLARALVAAANRRPHPANREALLTEAQNLYREIALQPAYFWYHASRYSPGLWGDALAAWVRLAAGDPQREMQADPYLRNAVLEFSRLRPLDFQRIPGLSRAIAQWTPSSVPQPQP
jgi:serine/threonine protein kinase/tetratricopeptide (TPR) repeat protein